MEQEDVRPFLGKVVRDPYGRYVGTLVGFCVEPSGELKSVGIDRGAEGFTEFPAERFTIENEGVVLRPEWALMNADATRDTSEFEKKLAALKELAKEMGIPESKVESMAGRNDNGQDAVRDLEKLAQAMAGRGAEIERQTNALDDFVTKLTLQYEAGEIEKAVFKMTTDYCKYLRVRNLFEIEELSRTLKGMAGPEPPQRARVHVRQVQPVRATKKKEAPTYTSRPKLTNIEAVESQPRRSSAQERMIAELP